MAAMFWATFDTDVGTQTITVYSADARTFKPTHIRESYRKARVKARAKLKKLGRKGRLTSIRCVG